MAQDTAHGLTLIRRFNALMREKDAHVQAAGGWLGQTDPAWRADWRRRFDENASAPWG